MIKLGLTGSIGMGKSTTAQMFRDLGHPVFDADAAVHNLYAKGGRAVPLIKAVFPECIKDEAVDRTCLSAHMQNDPHNLEVLISFVHPWVGHARQEFIKKAEHTGAKIIVFDVPLLFETDGDALMDKTVVVTAPYSVQRERVLSRPGMTETLFKTLLSRQISDEKKRARADYLVFTDKGLDFAREQVQSIARDLLGEA